MIPRLQEARSFEDIVVASYDTRACSAQDQSPVLIGRAASTASGYKTIVARMDNIYFPFYWMGG